MRRIISFFFIILICLPVYAIIPEPKFDSEKHKFGYAISGSEFFIIAPRFQEARNFKFDPRLPADYMASVKSDGKYGFINQKGVMVINPRFDDTGYFLEDMAWVKVGDKKGFIDRSGKMVIEPKFSDAKNFSEGVAPVMIDGKWSYIDKMGRFVFDLRFDGAWEFGEGLATVKKKNKYAVIDKEGNTVFESPTFVRKFGVDFEGLAEIVGEPKKGYTPFGFVDRTGNIILEPIYFVPYGNVTDGILIIGKDHKSGSVEKYGAVNNKGEIIIQPEYDYLGYISEGRIMVREKGNIGFFDYDGNLVIEPKFPLETGQVTGFNDGLALVNIGGKKGYIDKDGNVAIEPVFDAACNFSDGMARVRIGDKWGYIDVTGKLVVQPQLFLSQDFSNGYAVTNTRSGYGVIDKSGSYLIEPKYSKVRDAGDGLFCVQDFKNGWSLMDLNGNNYSNYSVALAEIERQQLDLLQYTFNQLIANKLGTRESFLKKKGIDMSEQLLRREIENEVAEWQKKGEFETSADYKIRVNEQTRQAKAMEVAKRLTDDYNRRLLLAREEYQTKYDALVKQYCEAKAIGFNSQTLTLKPYDADNQTYLISTAEYGDILLPVPLENAPAFKSNWDNIKKSVKATFVPVDNDVALQSVAFGPYVYDSTTKASYAQVDIADNFRPIDIAGLDLSFGAINDASSAATSTVSTSPVLAKREVKPDRTTIEVGSSDVDVNIPTTRHSATNTFAVVIANKDYEHASKVNNAENDGRVMAQYLNQTIGIPKENITTCIDATYGQIASALGHLQDIGKAYSNEDFNVIFYYVGHGLPDDNNRESHILPVDVDPRNIRVCYPLKDIYKLLGGLGAKNVTVLIDACFSGANHGDGMLMAQAMGVTIKPKELNPMGNTVVLAAAQGDETAFPYEEKSHGLFTYWLLKKLQETKGEVTIGELSDFVKDKVSKTATVINHKPQTPTVSTSPSLANTWRTLPFSR